MFNRTRPSLGSHRSGRFGRRVLTKRVLTAAFLVVGAIVPGVVLSAPTPAAAGTSGSTWQVSTTLPTATAMYTVSCPSGNVCYVGGESNLGAAVIEATNDGGDHWEAQTPAASTRAPLAIACPSDTECVGGGTDMTGDPTIFATVNAGASWARQTPPHLLFYYDGVSCPTTTVCAAVGFSLQGHEVALTTNGGTTWSLSSGLFPGPLTSVACPTAVECVTVGVTPTTHVGVTYHTLTGHGTWTAASAPATVATLQSIACPSAADCVAVGHSTNGGASIIKTTDGGLTWSLQSTPSALSLTGILNGVACTSITVCEAVGESAGKGVAAGTTDGGATWTMQQIAPTADAELLNGVSCAGPTCIAVGMAPGGGVVLKLGAATSPPGTTTSVHRIFGSTPPGTSVAVFEHQFPVGAGGCPDTAVLATDAGFSDALVSSYLAGHLDTATFVTPPAKLAPIVRAALADEGIAHVYVVGGPLAVSTSVVKELRSLRVYKCGGRTAAGSAHLSVTRIYGATAISTAEAVAEYLPASDAGAVNVAGAYAGTNSMGGRGRYNTTEANGSVAPKSFGKLRSALLSTIARFPDTESASAMSYADHFPILLTTPAVLSGQARAAIRALHIAQVIVVGGQLAVSDAAVKTLQGMGISVVRVAGIDFEGTATEVADFALGSAGSGLGLGWTPTGGVVVASGEDFAASVTGAVVAADGGPGRRSPEPLLLTQDATVLGTSMAAFLHGACVTGIDHDNVQVTKLTLLGAPDAISANALRQMEAYLPR